MTRIRLLKRVLFAVPVMGAMVFGTAQAFASTATQQEARACTVRGCNFYCGGAGGVCSAFGVCVCR
jgi:hypothetical protein